MTLPHLAPDVRKLPLPTNDEIVHALRVLLRAQVIRLYEARSENAFSHYEPYQIPWIRERLVEGAQRKVAREIADHVMEPTEPVWVVDAARPGVETMTMRGWFLTAADVERAIGSER